MTSPLRQTDHRAVLLATVAYVVVGIGTAALAGAATSPLGVTGWRLAAWVLSLLVFLLHLASSVRHRRIRMAAVAFRVALAVALGALLLAAFGPVRSHWHDPHRARVALLSLVAWPLLTGVPAFFAALLGGYVVERLSGGSRAPADSPTLTRP